MARLATIQKAETWVYIDDELTEVPVDEKKPTGKKRKLKLPIVKELGEGKKPPGGGSVFLLGPVPHDLYLEVQFYGNKDTQKLRSGRVPSELELDTERTVPVETAARARIAISAELVSPAHFQLGLPAWSNATRVPV